MPIIEVDENGVIGEVKPIDIEPDDDTDSECDTDEDVLKISFTRMMNKFYKYKELNGGKIDNDMKERLLSILDALEKRKAILETRQENADEPEYEAEPCEDCGKLITEDETKCYSQGCISVNCCEECYDKNKNLAY